MANENLATLDLDVPIVRQVFETTVLELTQNFILRNCSQRAQVRDRILPAMCCVRFPVDRDFDREDACIKHWPLSELCRGVRSNWLIVRRMQIAEQFCRWWQLEQVAKRAPGLVRRPDFLASVVDENRFLSLRRACIVPAHITTGDCIEHI